MTPLEVFDLKEALSRVDGDRELLRELADIFLSEVPKQLEGIRKAVGEGDSKALQRTAHSLKGSVGNFCAKASFEAAFRLEKIGREGDLAQAGEALAALEKEIEQLLPALAEIKGD